MAMTDTEAEAFVLKTNETLAQVAAEADGVIAANKKLQEELAAAIAAGDSVPPGLEAAIKANGTRVDALHEVLPDVPRPE